MQVADLDPFPFPSVALNVVTVTKVDVWACSCRALVAILPLEVLVRTEVVIVDTLACCMSCHVHARLLTVKQHIGKSMYHSICAYIHNLMLQGGVVVAAHWLTVFWMDFALRHCVEFPDKTVRRYAQG